MIVQEIIERIRAIGTVPFAIVDGAAELADVKDRPNALPAAYVLSTRDASADNSRATGLLQRNEIDVAVVLITENLSDDRGAAAAGDIEVLKKAVRKALLGWQPASAEDVITHVSGELVRAREGVVWWEDVFATAIYLGDED